MNHRDWTSEPKVMSKILTDAQTGILIRIGFGFGANFFWFLAPIRLKFNWVGLLLIPSLTHVWVVHHALLQGLIRYAWGASLTDVGLQGCGVKGYKASPWPEDPSIQGSHTRGRGKIRAGLAPQNGQWAECAREKSLTLSFMHNFILQNFTI